MSVTTIEDKPWFPIRYTGGHMPAAVENLLYLVDVETNDFSRQASFRDHNIRHISTPSDIRQALLNWNVAAEIHLINDLTGLSLPAILKSPEIPHHIVLVEIWDDVALYIDPLKGWSYAPISDFLCNDRGMAITVTEVLPWRGEDYKNKQKIKTEAVNHYLHNNLKEIRGFLDNKTCEYLIDLAENHYEVSTIGNNEVGAVVDEARISRSAGLRARNNPIVKGIMKKAGKLLSNVPDKAFEMMQCVHYQRGGLFNAHFDTTDYYSLEKVRGYTVLINLNDEYEGGSTYFPELNYTVQSEKGKALVFKLLDDNGQIDQLSLHTALQLTEGEKYMGVLFVRTPKTA